MIVFDFVLGTAASLLATAVDRCLSETPGKWDRRKLDRRIASMTDAIIQPLLDYFEHENIDEETVIVLTTAAEKPFRALIEEGDELLRLGLDRDGVVSHVLENMLDEPAHEVKNEYPAAFDTVLQAYADLAIRTPPLFADWEQLQFATTYRKLAELESYLSRMYGDMRKLSKLQDRGDSLIDRMVSHQASSLAIKMSLHGLRSTELPQTDVDNLFILPHFAEMKQEDGRWKHLEILSPAQFNECFVASQTAQRSVVSAPAGAGKTTWIEWLSARILENHVFFALPIVIRLRQALRATSLPTLLEAVRSSVSPAFHDKFAAHDVEGWAQSGKLFLLLDGFDEVPEKQRNRVVDWIEGLSAADPSLNIVLTSRPLTTSHIHDVVKSGFRLFSLEPFDQGQVEEYIAKYQRFGPPIQTGAPNLSPSQLAETWRRDPSLLPLTANPLLLSTLLAVHHMDGELPKGRSELYERYVDGMLGAWENRKELTPPDVALTKQSKRSILEALAVNMIANEVDAVDENEAASWINECLDNNGISASVRTVLEHLRERSGLLIGPGQYGFVHKSIGEFLVACACHNGVSRDQSGQRFDRMFLTKKSSEDRWLMVVFLWAGIAPAADVQIFIDDLIASDQLGLASGLLVEFGERLDPEQREKTFWVFLNKRNSLGLELAVSSAVDPHNRFFCVPLSDAVTNTSVPADIEAQRPGSVDHEYLPAKAFNNSWADAGDWSQHLDSLDMGTFLDLSQQLGHDKALAARSVTPVSTEEQVCWLTLFAARSHSHSSSGTSDQIFKIGFDYSTLAPFSSAIWRGIAMYAVVWSVEEFEEINDTFLSYVGLEGAKPPQEICYELCELIYVGVESDGETWAEKIAEIVNRDDFPNKSGSVYEAIRLLHEGCVKQKRED